MKTQSIDPSRSQEARKARRVVRTALRYSIMASAPDVSKDEQAEFEAKAEKLAKSLDASLAILAKLRKPAAVVAAPSKKVRKSA